jgi:hypothetical protein
VKVMVWCAIDSWQGVTAHWLGAVSPTPGSATLTPMSGIAKVCEARVGSIAAYGFPSIVSVPPTVPRGCDQSGFRSPLAPS